MSWYNSFANQGILLRDDLGYVPDYMYMLSHNSVRSIAWTGTPSGSLNIPDNHLHEGSNEPVNGLRTTIGGDGHSLYNEASVGSFAPTAQLLDYAAIPALRYDMTGQKRSLASSPGCHA